MELRLERLQRDADVTIGSLTIDGAFQCWTLEPGVRADGVKIPNETAAPYGSYNLQITPSPRFKRDLPLLINVRGFDAVRIHPGNTASDPEGCILVGCDRYARSIGRTRVAFDALFLRLKAAKIRGEAIDVEITDA